MLRILCCKENNSTYQNNTF